MALVTFTFFTGLLVLFTLASGYRIRVFVFSFYVLYLGPTLTNQNLVQEGI
jgi:hypothetical protein